MFPRALLIKLPGDITTKMDTLRMILHDLYGAVRHTDANLYEIFMYWYGYNAGRLHEFWLVSDEHQDGAFNCINLLHNPNDALSEEEALLTIEELKSLDVDTISLSDFMKEVMKKVGAYRKVKEDE